MISEIQTHVRVEVTQARGVSLLSYKLFPRAAGCDTRKAKIPAGYVSHMSTASTHLSNYSDSTYITQKYLRKSHFRVLTIGEEGHSIVSVRENSRMCRQALDTRIKGASLGAPASSSPSSALGSIPNNRGSQRVRFGDPHQEPEVSECQIQRILYPTPTTRVKPAPHSTVSISARKPPPNDISGRSYPATATAIRSINQTRNL